MASRKTQKNDAHAIGRSIEINAIRWLSLPVKIDAAARG
jgi:hypothetical protein